MFQRNLIISCFFVSLFCIGLILPTISAHANTFELYQFDKSSMIKKKLADAQNYLEKDNYEAAMNSLKSLLKLDPDNSKAKELLSKCEYGIQRQKAKIQEAFLKACNDGTKSALQSFISSYPNSEYIKEAKIRIEDYDNWQKAKSINTIEGYNTYLTSSQIKAYKEDANSAIKKIKAEADWAKCKDSNNEQALNDFITSYPESNYINVANYRLNIIRGEKYYNSGNKAMAYSYLRDADNFQTLTGTPAMHLKEIKDQKEYENLMYSSDTSKIRAYLNTISKTSPYYKPLSNHLSKLLGSSLGWYSSDYSINEALSYAMDKETRAEIQSHLDESKHLHRLNQKQERRNKIRANGGIVQFGWEIMDMGFFGLGSENENSISFYYNMGFSVKLGNYKSPVQFELGIKPGIAIAKYTDYVYYSPYSSYNNYYGYNSYYYYDDYDYGYDYEESEVYFHMPLFAKLKLNLFNVGSSKFYMAGIGSYNAIRKNEFENEFSAGAGAGFAWKRWDWLCLYYKQDIADKIHRENKTIGSSLIVFF